MESRQDATDRDQAEILRYASSRNFLSVIILYAVSARCGTLSITHMIIANTSARAAVPDSSPRTPYGAVISRSRNMELDATIAAAKAKPFGNSARSSKSWSENQHMIARCWQILTTPCEAKNLLTYDRLKRMRKVMLTQLARTSPFAPCSSTTTK